MRCACLNLELICLHNQHRQAFSMHAHLCEVKQTAISASDSRVVAVVWQEERAAKAMECIEMPVIDRIKAFNENTSSNKTGCLFLFSFVYASLSFIGYHFPPSYLWGFFFISVNYVASSFAVIDKWNKIHWVVRIIMRYEGSAFKTFHLNYVALDDSEDLI